MSDNDASNLFYTDLIKNLLRVGLALLPLLVGIIAVKYNYKISDLDIPMFIVAIAFVGLVVASFGMLVLRFKKSKNKN